MRNVVKLRLAFMSVRLQIPWLPDALHARFPVSDEEVSASV